MSTRKQALTSLQFYLTRSQDALKCLDQGDLEEVMAILRKKTAAFHNFKVADAALQVQGIDLRNDAEIAEIFVKILEIDKRLKSSLESCRGKVSAKLNAQIRVNNKINHYGSGSQSDNEIELKI